MAIRIEGSKISIELEQNSPEEFYRNLLKDMVNCIQALQETDMEDVYFLLELYKAMLPDQEQVNKMFGKE